MISFAAQSDPAVSIIIVAWREAPFLLPCLESVSENVTGPYEVILVLNEPSSSLEEKVSREVVGASVLRFRANLGFGGGVNVAAETARGRYLLLLNDDSVVQRGWMEALVETAHRRPKAGMVGSTYLHPDGTLQEAGSVVWRGGATSAFSSESAEAAGWQFERRVDYCSGGSLLIRRDLWDQLGGFDDRYYPAYFEDSDMALRAQELGWEVWYQPLSILRHVRSGSSGRLHQFLYERSRERFLERWGPRLEGMESRGDFEKAAWRAMGHPIRVLILDDYLPDRGIGAGYVRMRDTVETLASDPGIHVAVYPTVTPRMDPAQLASLGVRVVADLESHLATAGVDYEIVVVSRPNNFTEYHDLLRKQLPGAKLIYDAEALFYRRVEAQLEYIRSSGGPVAADRETVETLQSELARVREEERRIFSAADVIVCISEDEAALVRADATGPVHMIEPWLAAPPPTVSGFAARAHIGLVAGWAAGPGSPNAEGLLWFAHEVLPKVRTALPGCQLKVTGANPPRDVSWLDGRSVQFVGFVQDLGGFYEQVRVVISPTRFGAGVKQKTLEAIQYGVPVVATTDGAGGIDPELLDAAWVTDDPDEFADAVVAFYRDPDVWAAYRRRELAVGEAARSSRGNNSQWIRLVRDTVGAPHDQTTDAQTADDRGDT